MPRKPQPWFRTSTNWWMVTVGGRQYKLVDGEDNRDAAYDAFYRLMTTMVDSPESPDTTVASLCDAFLDWSKKNQAAKTYQGHVFWLQSFVEACGQRKAVELKPYHITQWVDSKRTWRSSNSKYNAVRIAKRVFSWAVEQQLVDNSPLQGMRAPTPESRNDSMDEAVYRSLRRAAPRPLKCVLFALRQTGARPSEICQLTWDQVLGDRCVITKHKTAGKTGRPRVIYLSRNMRRLLRILRQRRGEATFVFLNCEGEPWNTDSIRQQLKRLKEKLKLKGNVYSYQLRHTFATNAILRGESTAVVAEMLGHVDTVMVSRVYAHLAGQPEIAAAADRAARPYIRPGD